MNTSPSPNDRASARRLRAAGGEWIHEARTTALDRIMETCPVERRLERRPCPTYAGRRANRSPNRHPRSFRPASRRAFFFNGAPHVGRRAFADRIAGPPAYSFTEPARENGDTD